MQFLRSLSFRTIGTTLLVLGACLIVLYNFAYSAILSEKQDVFDRNARIFTTFIADQINTGTRLKREQMIAPQLDTVLNNPDIDAAALRVTHVDGIEVANRVAAAFESRTIPEFRQPTFGDDVIVVDFDGVLQVYAPIVLGAGSDAVLVGELAITWDKSRFVATVANLFDVLRLAFLLTALVVAVAVFATLSILVTRPLQKVVKALSAVSAGEDRVALPKTKTLEVRQMVDATEMFIAKAKEDDAQLKDISRVLRDAKRGDFSKRITIDGAQHDEENVLRSMVNELLEAVDAGLSETIRVIDALSKRDLSAEMTGDFQGAFANLKGNVNHSLSTLDDTITTVLFNAEHVKAVAKTLSDSSGDLADRTQQNAATLEETSAAVSEISRRLQDSADLSVDAQRRSSSARQEAEKSRKVIEELVAAMNSIHKYSNDIADIITFIDDVAFQTNLLALNAGVEAARAGEHGRGFAVVASEVRGLAMRTSESAGQVKSLISNSATEVNTGVARVGEAGVAIKSLVDAISQVAESIQEISDGAKEQSLNVTEISTALDHLDRNTQHNAAMVEETSAQTRELDAGARDMLTSLQQFNLASHVKMSGADRTSLRAAS